MLKLSFLLLAFLTAFSSYSQVQKTQAIIIFTNNDSLCAETQDEQLHLIQTRIHYRHSDSSNFVTAFPEQIKSVRFTDGRLFETVKTDSVSFLLLCLIEGYYNLYKIERNGSISYYIRHAQDTPIHLVETFTDRYIQEDGEFRKISNFEYAHHLTNAMADNPRITMEISETKFVEDELVAIVKKYNEFKGNKYPEPTVNNKKSMKVSTGILISGYPFITDLHAPGLGMSFDFYRNRPYERFGLKTRVSFNILDYKKDDSYTFLIEIPIAMSYTYFDKGRVKLDLLGGVASFLMIDSYTMYGRQTNTSIYPGLYLGTGIDYKIKESAFRFEFSLLTMSFVFAFIF